MLDPLGMQTPYRSAESLRRDGTAVSTFVGWDGKVTTAVALLGGVVRFVREKMDQEGYYEEFVRVGEREYRRGFDLMFVL